MRRPTRPLASCTLVWYDDPCTPDATEPEVASRDGTGHHGYAPWLSGDLNSLVLSLDARGVTVPASSRWSAAGCTSDSLASGGVASTRVMPRMIQRNLLPAVWAFNAEYFLLGTGIVHGQLAYAHAVKSVSACQPAHMITRGKILKAYSARHGSTLERAFRPSCWGCGSLRRCRTCS